MLLGSRATWRPDLHPSLTWYSVFNAYVVAHTSLESVFSILSANTKACYTQYWNKGPHQGQRSWSEQLD